jgi:hypothetical protein
MNALVNSDNLAGGIADAMFSYVEPFVAPELVFNTLTHAVMGKDDRYKDIIVPSLKDPVFGSKWLAPENLKREFTYMARKLRPGIAKSINDAIDIAYNEPDDTGRIKTWEAFLLGHLAGLRVETFDPTVAATGKSFELKEAKAKARAIFGDHRATLNRGWKRLLETEGGVTEEQKAAYDKEAREELMEKFEVATQAYQASLDDAHKFYKNCLTVGLPHEKIVVILQDADFSEKNGEIKAIVSGNTKIAPSFKKGDNRY